MQIMGSRSLAAERHQVWDTLLQPEALRQSIPGCEQLEPLGPDRYQGKVTMRVAAIKASFSGTLAITDQEPHDRFRMDIEGTGSLGSIQASCAVNLSGPDGAVTVRYVWDMEVTGTMNTFGGPFLHTVTEWFANEIFKRVESQLPRIT